MKFRIYFVLLLAIPMLAFTMHKYYISLCEIEYIEEEQSIQIALGMFIDDIEFTLNKDYRKNLNIATPDEVSQLDNYFEEYLNKHFRINVNDKPKNYDYIGKEYEDDIVRFYLEITNIQHLNSIEVSNTSLFRDFNEQRNIIKIKVNNFHKTFYLDMANDKGLLNF